MDKVCFVSRKNRLAKVYDHGNINRMIIVWVSAAICLSDLIIILRFRITNLSKAVKVKGVTEVMVILLLFILYDLTVSYLELE